MRSNSSPTFVHSAKLCAFVVVFFYATYGLANWLSAWRVPLTEITFAWEAYIPFIEISIVPYWSLNVLYVLAIFLCRNHDEQRHLVRQLLATQCVAILCFVLFPLQMSWQKPPTSGISGSLFATVALFDAPYNQAPSLHIMLAMVVGAFYWRRFQAAWARKLTVIWFSLIGISVLTTWQHHFIDVPTGIFVASWIMWWLPENAQAPQWHRPNPFSHTRYAALYLFGAMILLILANLLSWWLLWGVVSCLIMALIYGVFGANAFQKQANGKHTLAMRILLLPYHIIGSEIAKWWTRQHPRHFITPKIELGSLFAAPPCPAVLDLSAEYPYPHTVAHYVNIPWLDLVAPSVADLRQAAQTLNSLHNQYRSVYVCCALGYERSTAVVVLWLAKYGGMESVAAAYQHVVRQRPQARLSAETLRHLEWAYAE
ncbi:phosphatase PAP2/dual specificity phosphatase family protein [Alysiella filiformis]|uniref:PAP2 superfamily protein n=1 Tax=Alysiella filiformis DSM 16848 TaxID=1120981 RepID=A0A286EGT7_9NEIS|nr:phosphatase PAP2/dual specificity phosphatase family protein [Alysiella filiformis]QMT32174.1 phosphatase PAP2/dual specificity phosphatase family protein [Alysiella filiformis]UBQ56903.1 phosphatase PAP2/dual specificity phosphatase family protein [Alysiella filiformis DSM 16848]SOD70132.1 PAP2 superfamily protein [Alysiella filiformis DSM 16848]